MQNQNRTHPPISNQNATGTAPTQEFNSPRLSDSIDIRRTSTNSNPRGEELYIDTRTSTTMEDISKPGLTTTSDNLRPHQPQPQYQPQLVKPKGTILATSIDNGNMPSSFTSTLNESTTTAQVSRCGCTCTCAGRSGSQVHDQGSNVNVNQQRPSSRRGSAYPDLCWGSGDAGAVSGHAKKTLVLCFDGTGNKFKGNPGDTNILKIFSMLDRRKGDQYHYYQPGIGTYLTSHAMMQRGSSKGTRARFKSAYQKAVDAAVGRSFDQHVMGGYRFLMRYYHPGDDIYMFGFSRGAYTARFLCEMLDHVGLVVQGNEEMVHFAWKTFSEWQMRAHDDNVRGKRKKEELYGYMKAFRETFTRPVKRVRFLGLFDTVNSVPRFEDAWLKRASRFPYTARSTARVIRHAVGLDERRAKFRQDLVEKLDLAELNDTILRSGGKEKTRQRSWGEKEKSRMTGAVKDGIVKGPIAALNGTIGGLRDPATAKTPPDLSLLRMKMDEGPASSLVSLNIHLEREDGDDDDTGQDVEELWFPGAHGDIGGGWDLSPGEHNLAYGPLVWMVREARRAGLAFDEERLRQLGCYTDLEALYDHEQDEKTYEAAVARNPAIEVRGATPASSPVSAVDAEKSLFFPPITQQTNGGGERRRSSTYDPLRKLKVTGAGGDATFNYSADDDHEADPEVYAVRLPPQNTPMDPYQSRNPFDLVFTNFKKNRRDSTIASSHPVGTQQGASATSSSRNVNEQNQGTTVSPRPLTPRRSPPHRAEIDDVTEKKLKFAYTQGKIHCCLTFGGGLPHMSTIGWRMMEYLPFRRMDLQKDGSWKAISWPLPMGEVRDVPEDAKVHISVLKRMQADPTYRPGNLLVGGGGRGVRVAPPEYGIGEWVTLREEGSLVGEVLVKKSSLRPKGAVNP